MPGLAWKCHPSPATSPMCEIFNLSLALSKSIFQTSLLKQLHKCSLRPGNFQMALWPTPPAVPGMSAPATFLGPGIPGAAQYVAAAATAGEPSMRVQTSAQQQALCAPGSSTEQLRLGQSWVPVTPNIWPTAQTSLKEGTLVTSPQPEESASLVMSLSHLLSSHSHRHVRGPPGFQTSKSIRMTWKATLTCPFGGPTRVSNPIGPGEGSWIFIFEKVPRQL